MKFPKDICQKIISKYELGHIKNITHLTSGFTNANFRVKTDQGKVLFRLCLDKSIPEIKYEMGLLKGLQKVGVPLASPLSRKRNKFINKTKLGPVVLYEYISGKEPIPSDKVNRRIGKAVAKLNLFPDWKNYPRKNPIGIKYCLSLAKKLKKAPSQYAEIADYFIKQTQHLAPIFDLKLPKGLIHGDVFADNTKFKDQKLLAILDFEEACIDVLMIDVGVTINGFCFVDNQLNKSLLEAFLRGYHKHRKLSELELTTVPLFIQWGAHCMIAWHIQRLLEEPDERRLKRVEYLIKRVKELRKEEKKLTKFVYRIGG